MQLHAVVVYVAGRHALLAVPMLATLLYLVLAVESSQVGVVV